MNAPDLVAAVLELEPRAEVRIPRSHGVLVHAGATNLLDRLAPRLRKDLHDVRATRQPFTGAP